MPLVTNATTYTFPSGAVYALTQVYTQAEANGVTVLIVTSVISLISVVGLLVALGLSAFNTRFSSNDQLFVRTHVAFYFLSLLVCEILQAIGSIMSINWVQNLEVFVGPFCTAQAIIKQTADVGAATWSFILALHTFCVLFLEWQIQTYVRWLILISGWSFIATIGFAGPATADSVTRGPFHGISGFWCWINSEYDIQRLTLDYLLIFLSLFFSFALYLLVFLRLRGNIIINGWNVKFRFIASAKKQSWNNHNFQERQILIIARQMLWYPVAYTAIVFPVAAARFSYFAGHPVPFTVTIFCDVIYLLSGFVNVILFSTTRSVIPKRSVLKFVISRPTVMEPDYAEDPDDYYPDIDDSEKGTSLPVDAFYGGQSHSDSTPRVLDIERMGMSASENHHDGIGPPTAKPFPITPIFRRDSSYQASESGSEPSDYCQRRAEHGDRYGQQDYEHEQDHPIQLQPGQSHGVSERHHIVDSNGDIHFVPQLQMPNNALIASRTMLPSPEDEHDLDRDFYDLYEHHSPNHAPTAPTTPTTGRQRNLHGPMHDVSLE